MERLKPSEIEVLRNILVKRSPDLVPLLELLGEKQLTTGERESLRSVLADEMMENGLSENEEPNEWGCQLDDLIGKLMWH